MPEVRLVRHDAVNAVAYDGNVLYVAWLGKVTAPAVVAIRRASDDLAREHPRGIAHVNLIARGMQMSRLEDDARQSIVSLLRDPESKLVCSAIAYTEPGFMAATVRGVLAGLALVGITGPKLRFFGEVGEIERWVCTQLGAARAGAPREGEIVDGVASFRRALGADGARV